MFVSKFSHVGHVKLPTFSDTRVMMLPLVLGDPASIPDFVSHYKDVLANLSRMHNPSHLGKVGYLTVDEKEVTSGKTHRRAGMHVDGGSQRGWGGGGGVWGGGYSEPSGIWGGNNGGSWGSTASGMLTVSSHPGCRAWSQEFEGEVGHEGSCEHLRHELKSEGIVLGSGEVFWLDGTCVHESIPMTEAVKRQFIRLSLPSTCPWYEGYTVNPLGILPTGEILPRRSYMDA